MLGFLNPFTWPARIVKFLLFAAVVIFAIMFFTENARAACMGANHLPFTKGSVEECKYRYNLKQSRKSEAKRPGTLSSEIQAWESVLDGKQNYVKRIGYDKLHSLQINWGIYYMPHELGYRRQFTSHFAPSAFTYHYYFNPSFSIGAKYQAYKLAGTPFVADQGSDSLDIMRWWGHATFHFDVAPGFEMYAQMGMVIMDSSRVWLNGSPKADTVGDDQFLAEFGIGYYVGSNKLYGGLKFNDAPNGSRDINTYHNLGDAELFAGIELGLF
jgi:hypothetical protein